VSGAGQKHHYIPVFYLKQWRGPDGRLYEYSRPYNIVKAKPVHPDGTGYVRGLYAIEGLPPEAANVLETQFLKPVDGSAAEALQALAHGEPFTRPAQMRTAWCRFVLSLMLRFPEALEQMKVQLRANVEKVYAETRTESDPPTFDEYERLHNTGELARLHGKLLIDLMLSSKMSRLIFRMHWGVMEFRRYQHTLLTSDRPVATNILPLQGNHICIPIGPTKMFFASETEKGEQDFQHLDPKLVMQASNDMTVRRASRYVYGRDNKQVRFVENRLAGQSRASFGF
jgi:hypothetical protein